MNEKPYQTTSHQHANHVYNATSDAKTTERNEPNPQAQIYSYNMPVFGLNNAYTPTNPMESFSAISPQQNYQKQFNWDNGICEEVTSKIPEKMDIIEITSKDLSPSCGNLDLLMSDFYKTFNPTKDFGYYSPQYATNNTKPTDYPSCAQSNFYQNTLHTDKTVKYCSIQNMSQEFDYNRLYDYNNYSDANYTVKNNLHQDYYFYDNTKPIESTLPNQYFELPTDLQIDQNTECSNEESDIVVEESDEETDGNDYDYKKFPTETNRCVICNVSYRPVGVQFYFLTHKSPLTMSTQKPVYRKIAALIRNVQNTTNNYLCSECLGLINTIDHLQLKLNNFNAELLTKFRVTCRTNNVPLQKRHKFHMKSDVKLRCKTCKHVLSMRALCRRHYVTRHKSKGFLCETCGHISKTVRLFHRHQKIHKVRVKKIPAFQCNNCTKYFRTKTNLTEHVNYCLGLLPHACKFCDKKFASSTKLKDHVRLKHDKKFIAICSICNIGFVKLSDYKNHKLSHGTDKKFSCTKCDKAYKTLSNLNFHMKVHQTKLPYNCDICFKGFMRKDYLESHVNNHNGIKNYACPHCSKKFVSQKNLDSHMKLHEGAVKTKTCDVCDKVMASGFEEHMRVHNNLKEFECDLCDGKFNTKGTLAKHKTRKHPTSLN